ncbi:MAG: diguanylate cyclase [bacterium]|nr:diguanylate cyclase [bacterium]
MENILSMDWVLEFPAAITVCDDRGIILAMNERACNTFHGDGGAKLIGTSLLDCHPEPSRTKLIEMLKSHEKNVYTIEKNGIKKMIYQSPWFEHGEYRGFVEMSLEIPFEMPHFVRKP